MNFKEIKEYIISGLYVELEKINHEQNLYKEQLDEIDKMELKIGTYAWHLQQKEKKQQLNDEYQKQNFDGKKDLLKAKIKYVNFCDDNELFKHIPYIDTEKIKIIYETWFCEGYKCRNDDEYEGKKWGIEYVNNVIICHYCGSCGLGYNNTMLNCCLCNRLINYKYDDDDDYLEYINVKTDTIHQNDPLKNAICDVCLILMKPKKCDKE